MLRSLLQAPIRVFSRYNRALIESPYKTKMATAGTAFFIADCICQRYVENKSIQEYSLKRSVRQSSVGVFFAGPSLHIWHTMVIPKIAQRFSSKSAKIFASVVSTEVAFGMYFVCSLLFYFEVLKTQSVEAGVKNVENKFWPTFGNSLKFWPFVSVINFSLISDSPQVNFCELLCYHMANILVIRL